MFVFFSAFLCVSLVEYQFGSIRLMTIINVNGSSSLCNAVDISNTDRRTQIEHISNKLLHRLYIGLIRRKSTHRHTATHSHKRIEIDIKLQAARIIRDIILHAYSEKIYPVTFIRPKKCWSFISVYGISWMLENKTKKIFRGKPRPYRCLENTFLD